MSVDDLAGLRLAFSPLWEVVASVRVLQEPAAHALHLPWAKSARAAIDGGQVDVALLQALVPVPTRLLPGFLAPTPASPLPDLDDELALLTATDPDRCRADLLDAYGGVQPLLAPLHDDPPEGLRGLARQIRAYFDAVLAPSWPRIRGLLEGDVMYRAQRLAQGGAAHLFADLDPTVSWTDGTLHIAHPTVHRAHRLDGRGLVLVPSAFTWPRVFTKVAGPWPPVVRYPARGIATLWETARADPGGLARVLGSTRTRLLHELAAPASTTELARRTGLAPGGVSSQLARLRDAGLVSAHRTGSVVLYARTPRADGLLAD
jgi:DNA-binding transcriptional ArsR family regulator